MQLRFALSVPKFTGSGFNQTTSAILTGVTIAGAFATVIFQSGLARNEVNKAFNTFASLLQKSAFGSGINKLAGTFKDWGTLLVSKKDDFKEWVRNYLNPEGFKSGAAELYQKLYEWVEIVYNWFATKFLEFLKNIPKIVENWKSIRLSLFKWGTFLGGGGGSAIWGAMFGSGDSWAKLGDLMGHPDFAEMMSDFNQLVEDNQEAFEEMGEEGIRDILEKYLDNPEEAKQAAKELLEEQKKMKEENEKKEPEEKKEESEKLSAEEIQEKFSGQKGGKPQSPPQVLTQMVQEGLSNSNSSSFEVSPYSIKQKAIAKMNEYINKIEDYSKRRKNKTAEAQKEFLDVIKDQKEAFVSALAEAIVVANQKAADSSKLNEEFIKALESSVTQVCKKEEECDSVDLSKVLEK